jgi:uncharacterized protein YcfJ
LRTKLMATLAMGLATVSLAAAPMAAEAATKKVWVCDKVTKKANQGTAIGAVSGGVLGNVVAGRGNKTEGTLLGAGVGAVVGHQVAKNKAKKNCHYAYVKVRSRS